jgi:transmembrane sensor
VTEPSNPASTDLPPKVRDALAWVVRLRSGEATQADVEDVRAWRAASTEHEVAFVQAVQLWRRLQATADAVMEAGGPEPAARGPLAGLMGTPTRRAVLVGAAAACGVAFSLLRHPPLDLWPSLDELRADFRTTKGERRMVAVDDGVAVTMNTQTSLTIASQGDRPVVRLVAGEMEVKTTRPLDRWLTVRALGLRISATEADFSARCIAGEVVVTCLGGTVDVESDRITVPLHSNESVSYSDVDGLSNPVAANREVATAWQRGLIIVRSRPLAEVVDEVNRYRDGRIVVTNADLGGMLVSGTFQIDRLEIFPSQVQQLLGARVHTLPGGVVLLS